MSEQLNVSEVLEGLLITRVGQSDDKSQVILVAQDPDDEDTIVMLRFPLAGSQIGTDFTTVELEGEPAEAEVPVDES